MTRRDKCHLAGLRAAHLKGDAAAAAWQHMANSLGVLGLRDVPKFNDLYQAIRRATIAGKNPHSAIRTPQ